MKMINVASRNQTMAAGYRISNLDMPVEVSLGCQFSIQSCKFHTKLRFQLNTDYLLKSRKGVKRASSKCNKTKMCWFLFL